MTTLKTRTFMEDKADQLICAVGAPVSRTYFVHVQYLGIGNSVSIFLKRHVMLFKSIHMYNKIFWQLLKLCLINSFSLLFTAGTVI
jgi:hypothetical protein